MDKLNEFITNVEREILTPIVTLLALFAFAVFVWGIVQFIANAGDEEKRKTGQMHMFWGIIGLVIIFGANAIIRLMANTVGADVPF
ncbi:MAG TPA: pilin [Candidatus Paceibacterota bacterium]|nr:pilin [Candidatus Paceibacterota bacterium]